MSTTKCNIDFFSVAERLREVVGATDTGASLAHALGIEPKKFAVWKARGIIPPEQVIAICSDKGYSTDYVLLGRKPGVSTIPVTETGSDPRETPDPEQLPSRSSRTEEMLLELIKSYRKSEEECHEKLNEVMVELGVLRERVAQQECELAILKSRPPSEPDKSPGEPRKSGSPNNVLSDYRS